MNIGQAVGSVLRQYAVFRGRASRSEFWWYYLAYLIVFAILSLLDQAMGLNGILIGIFALALIIPTIAVQVRRLHDTDRSGGWWFIGLIPIIGAIVLIVFFVQASTPGDNRFGAQPA